MRKSLVIVPAALVLAGIGAAAVLVRPAPSVRPGTYVAGVALGGLGGARLAAELNGPVRAKVEQAIRVSVDGSSGTAVLPESLGLRLDADATRSAVKLSRLRFSRAGRHDVTPVVAVPVTAEKALVEQLSAIRREPRDRTVELSPPSKVIDGKEDLSYTASDRGVTVDEGEPGRGFDAAVAVRQLAEAMRTGSTTVRLAVTTLPAGSGTLAGVDQLIGTFTTYHPCCAPRVTNIHRIAELVDGTVVAAGKTFSLNDKVGERTAENGFVAAPAIVDGELEDQLGGGVSQFSTTLFNAAWFAGLDIRKHQPHSLYITRYPPGREATLDWRSIDQVIHNDTQAPMVIRVHTTGTSITVGLYGHTGDRVVSSVTGPRQPRDGGGFAVSVKRTVLQDGSVQSTDTLRWTYQGLD